MTAYRLRHHQLTFQLPNKPFASGGEGHLYRVKLPELPGEWVAKIYHQPKRTAEREAKSNYLLNHRPAALVAGEDKDWMWVKDIIYNASGQFMGLLLPFVKGEKLEILCSQKLPRSLSAGWRRMDLRQEGALDYRIKVGFNLAVAVYRLHSTEHYVLVDMKPDNVLIQPNGLLSMVDLDSVAINEGARALFPAPVATPEYTPPEYYTTPVIEGQAVDPAWDRFGLAVILYKLFCGIHPFAATANPPYDGYVSLHQKIEHGLFVHSASKRHHLRVIPPPHERFKQLPEPVQELFIQCFEVGHDDPSWRPTAEEWCVALLYAIGEPQLMKRYQSLLGADWHQPMSKMALPSEMEQQQAPTGFDPSQWVTEQLNQWVPALPNVPEAALKTLETTLKNQQKETRRFYGVWWVVGLVLLFVLLEGGLKYAPPATTYGWTAGLAIFWMVVLPRVLAWGNRYIMGKLPDEVVYQQLNDLKQQNEVLRQTITQEMQQQLKAANANLKAAQKLPDLPEQWQTFEQETSRLREERQKAFEAVRLRYLKKGLEHPQLKDWEASSLYDLWQQLQRSIRQERARLSHHNPVADQARTLEVAYKENLHQLRAALDEQLKEWGDEARFLFDLDVLFEDEAQGLLTNAEGLRNALQRKGINRLIDLRAVHWKDQRYLSIKGEGRAFELSTSRYPPLENFYQLYSHYAEAIAYIQKHEIQDGKTYLQQRFKDEKGPYDASIQQLQDEYKTQTAALEQEKQALTETSDLPALLELKEMLSDLRQAQQEELQALETHYNALYTPIRTKIEAMIEDRYEHMTEQRDAYKIAVQTLLGKENLVQEQQALQTEVQAFEGTFEDWQNRQTKA